MNVKLVKLLNAVAFPVRFFVEQGGAHLWLSFRFSPPSARYYGALLRVGFSVPTPE